jgi:membrane fusion protein, multidrug efflux system
MKKSISITLAIITAVLAGGCSRGNSKPGAAGAPVLVAKTITTNVPVQIQPEPVGHVQAFSSVTVRSQITGILSRVHFREGQEVKKGDLLFTIDPRPMQAALAAAQANLARDQAQLENARIQFARAQKLLDQKLIPQDEFDTNKASMDALTGTVASDQAAVTNAQLNLEFTEIRAPFDGRTGSLQFHEGNVIKAQDDTLLTINQTHPIYVEFAVPEQYLPEIKKQMRAKTLEVLAAFENMDGPAPAGELTFVDNSVDETTGTILLKATFPNEDSALWPGQFVKVTLTLSELKDVVVAPTQAVQTGQNGQFVYVVKPDQTVEERPVVIGITYLGETVVQRGLATGETVVTDGQLRLAPGVKVSDKSSVLSTNAP